MKRLFAWCVLQLIRPALELDRQERAVVIDCGSYQVRLTQASARKHQP